MVSRVLTTDDEERIIRNITVILKKIKKLTFSLVF